jgi:hypothetical protein
MGMKQAKPTGTSQGLSRVKACFKAWLVEWETYIHLFYIFSVQFIFSIGFSEEKAFLIGVKA